MEWGLGYFSDIMLEELCYGKFEVSSSCRFLFYCQ